MIITMTTDKSFVTASYNGDFFVVEFPMSKEVFNLMRTVPGAVYNEHVAYKWTVPRSSYGKLNSILGHHIVWKTKEQMAQEAQDLAFKEETLEDVLNRIPKNIDTSFMKVEPFNFQKLSTAWAITKKGKKAGIYGGFLGDLMGLGKTIQAIMLSSYLKRNPLPDIGPIRKVLIICPATLKIQWGQEIERFTPDSYMIIDGGKGAKATEKRLSQYQEVREKDIFFTIMNYELLYQKKRLGKEEVKVGRKKENKVVFGDYLDLSEILLNEYDLIIIDEAQRFKNAKTKKYEALQQIQSPKIRLLMSGTPIEKDLQNIFPLFDYLSPDIFASSKYSFKDREKIFQDKFLVMGFNDFALRKSNGRTKILEVKGVKNLKSLNSLIKPYMLRRTTEDVSDEMPESMENDKLLDWHPIQKKLFDLFVEKRMMIEEQLGVELGKPNQNQEAILKLENDKKQIYGCLVQLCNTPELIIYSQSVLVKSCLAKVKPVHNYLEKFSKISKTFGVKEKNDILDSSIDFDEQPKDFTDKLFSLNKELSKIKPDFFLPPKLEYLLELVDNIVVDNNEKVVIFSRYVSMNKIIYRELFNHLNLTDKGRLKKDRVNIVYYNAESEKNCRWSDKIKKEAKALNTTPSNEPLDCRNCPFFTSCNSRTKNAFMFQNDPKTQVIICSDAAKEGVNLQAGKVLINYDLPESASIYNQRNGRIKRLHSKHKNVTIYNLLTDGGTDQSIRKGILKQMKRNHIAIEYNNEEKEAIKHITEEF